MQRWCSVCACKCLPKSLKPDAKANKNSDFGKKEETVKERETKKVGREGGGCLFLFSLSFLYLCACCFCSLERGRRKTKNYSEKLGEFVQWALLAGIGFREKKIRKPQKKYTNSRFVYQPHIYSPNSVCTLGVLAE